MIITSKEKLEHFIECLQLTFVNDGLLKNTYPFDVNENTLKQKFKIYYCIRERYDFEEEEHLYRTDYFYVNFEFDFSEFHKEFFKICEQIEKFEEMDNEQLNFLNSEL